MRVVAAEESMRARMQQKCKVGKKNKKIAGVFLHDIRGFSTLTTRRTEK